MMNSRRRFLSGAAAFSVASLVSRGAAGQVGTTIDVKKVGAKGGGKFPDLHALREAIAQAAMRRGPVTILFPPGEYFLGAADEAALLVARNMNELRIIGDRATLSCRSVNGQSTMLYLQGCRNVSVEGLSFTDYGLDRNVNWLGAAAIRLGNDVHRGCENVRIKDCRFDSVLTAVVCRNSDEPVRCRDITLSNLAVSRSYYGFSFHNNGDNVTGRNLRCTDVKRSYFPYGVANHDIDVEAVDNATGFADILIKCYLFDTSNLRVKVKSRGKRGGDAIVGIDQQHEKGHGVIRKITVDMDIDDVDCSLQNVVMMRSLDARDRALSDTTNRWDEIFLDGDVRMCNRTRLIHVGTRAKTPGRLHIGQRLARHPLLPTSFPGFIVTK